MLNFFLIWLSLHLKYINKHVLSVILGQVLGKPDAKTQRLCEGNLVGGTVGINAYKGVREAVLLNTEPSATVFRVAQNQWLTGFTLTSASCWIWIALVSGTQTWMRQDLWQGVSCERSTANCPGRLGKGCQEPAGGSGWHSTAPTPLVAMEYFLLGRTYVFMLSFSAKE